MSAIELISSTMTAYPRWGGPGSGFKATTDMMSVGAMASLRIDIENPEKDDDPSLQIFTSLFEASVAGKATRRADAPLLLAPGLLRYDRAIRETMAADEIASAIQFGMSTDKDPAPELSVNGHPLVRLLPPSPNTIQKQADIALRRAKLRNGKLEKVSRTVLHLHQLVAQHVDPLQPYVDALGISYETHPRTMELVASACSAMSLKIFRVKHALGVQRPHKLRPGIVPMLDVPGHRSYPGGHSAKSVLAARLLSALANKRELDEVLFGIAVIVGNNRVKAGLHYPMDTMAGAALGYWFSQWLVAVAAPSIEVEGVSFESTFDSSNDEKYSVSPLGVVPTRPLPHWQAMFLSAAEEWQ